MSRFTFTTAFALSLMITACANTTKTWTEKSYEIGAEKDVFVGESMVSKRHHNQLRNNLGTPLSGTVLTEELMYLGRSENTIRLMYRQFSGDYLGDPELSRDMIRPAFSVDVVYDLSQSDMITFRKWRIRVTSATNDLIRFVVVDD